MSDVKGKNQGDFNESNGKPRLVAHACCDPNRATQCRGRFPRQIPAALEMSQECRLHSPKRPCCTCFLSPCRCCSWSVLEREEQT